MRKVLLISYYYPPRPNIGGLRPHALAKHLPHYGWEAVVLTPGLPNVQRSDRESSKLAIVMCCRTSKPNSA